jgi:aminopeptidase N
VVPFKPMLTRSQVAERRALTAEDVEARSRTEIRFGCARPGATTFADLEVAKASVVLNGVEIPWTANRDGRLALPALDAPRASMAR